MKFLTSFLLFTLLPFFSLSLAFGDDQVASPHAMVSLVQRTKSCAVGTECKLGFHFQLEDGWHVYWQNPGDSGAAPKFKFIEPTTISHLPTGHDILQWPIPKKLPIAHLVNYGYEKDVVLSFVVPNKILEEEKNAGHTSLKFYVEGEWLVCREDCIPGSGSFELSVPLNSELANELSDKASFFDNQNIPQKASTHGTYEIIDGNLDLTSKEIPQGSLELFPIQSGIITNIHLPSVSIENNETLLSIPSKISKTKGVLPFLIASSPTSALEIDFYPRNGTLQEDSLSGEKTTLLLSFLFAIIGGIILNFMPCVFPVLGLKLFSALRTKEKSFLHDRILIAVSFLSGVCASLWFFLAILFIIRGSGGSIGWGFQLQNPWVVGALSILFIALTFNLLGFFEFSFSKIQSIGSAHRSNSVVVENFMSGLLTVLVASPCTAPFMGAALGVALSSPFIEAFIIFTGLGIGIALPFCLLITIPALYRLLPRPGAWMETLKKILAIPCLLTACWLGWVLYQQIFPVTDKNSEYVDTHGQHWLPYNEQLLSELQLKKKTVYVDFTAAWCISCQVNKALVFGDQKVRDLIQSKQIVLMRGDWTNQDPTITKVLTSFGKAGVPLDVLYTPNNEPYQFPSILTAGLVLDKLSE